MNFSATVHALADQIDAACDRGDDREANQLLRDLANLAISRLYDRGEYYGASDAAERTGFEPVADRPADVGESS